MVEKTSFECWTEGEVLLLEDSLSDDERNQIGGRMRGFARRSRRGACIDVYHAMMASHHSSLI